MAEASQVVVQAKRAPRRLLIVEGDQAVVAPSKPVVPDKSDLTMLPKGVRITSAAGQLTVRVESTPTENHLRPFGGSDAHAFNNSLLVRTLDTVVARADNEADLAIQIEATAAALAAFKPADEIEGMLAAQAVAMHFGAMECFRRSRIPGQHPDVASKLRKDGANLARGMADMRDAMDRKRGKRPQVVRIERVVVHEGGQAIVGNVRSAASHQGEAGE